VRIRRHLVRAEKICAEQHIRGSNELKSTKSKHGAHHVGKILVPKLIRKKDCIHKCNITTQSSTDKPNFLFSLLSAASCARASLSLLITLTSPSLSPSAVSYETATLMRQPIPPFPILLLSLFPSCRVRAAPANAVMRSLTAAASENCKAASADWTRSAYSAPSDWSQCWPARERKRGPVGNKNTALLK
jgi:hypothetical protein